MFDLKGRGLLIAEAMGITDPAPFLQGMEDGYEQGYELSMGMTYQDLNKQDEYDIGTHIGAYFKERGYA